jgi:hypothetical protein
MTNTTIRRALLALTPALPLALAACGGSSSSISDATTAERQAAASATASTNDACDLAILGPFYWEIGDATGTKGSGQVGSGAPAAGTVMSIASASKWLYAAYVVQKVGVRASDVPYLNFTSGYDSFVPFCQITDTVAGCLALGGDAQDAAHIGRFSYSGGHMQEHAATVMGMGALTAVSLAAEIQSEIGQYGMTYLQPELAGSVVANASAYAAFLRRMLTGDLALLRSLGTNRVCANPDATGCDAISSPILGTEDWGYSLGHWVEDDPVAGDGAFSSPGAFGFYPWISADKTLYGILAREDADTNAGFKSALCGRLIRQAWVTGVAVSSSTPSPGL